jgi:hypothetical protein
MTDSNRTDRERDSKLKVPRFHGVSFGEPPFVPTGHFVKAGRFGRMFPHLRPLNVSDAALKTLADAMKETPQQASSGALSNPDLPAGFTYLGQFVDHDITFDTTPMPERAVDPTQIHNFRTPALDLDSVYGDGPTAQPYLYQRLDNRKLLIGTASASSDTAQRPGVPALPNDLPRGAEGFALLGDPRNDENLLVAQTHLAFLKFHNKIVERDAKISFEDARRAMTWHYQWIVLHDLVTRLCGKEVVQEALEHRRFYCFDQEPFIPVEFAVAAYRLGHSLVREVYDHNRIFHTESQTVPRLAPASFKLDEGALLFEFSGASGGIGTKFPALPSNWAIDWRLFYDVGVPPPAGLRFNNARLLDPLLVPGLHQLPGGGGSLPERNLKRGVRLQLPSGQSVARAMRLDALTPKEVSDGPAGAVAKQLDLDEQSPLWFYILQEAKVKSGGKRLGPVGARIVAEVFVGLLEGDRTSFLAQNPRWKPDLGRTPGVFTMADMLNFVGDLNPIGD